MLRVERCPWLTIHFIQLLAGTATNLLTYRWAEPNSKNTSEVSLSPGMSEASSNQPSTLEQWPEADPDSDQGPEVDLSELGPLPVTPHP